MKENFIFVDKFIESKIDPILSQCVMYRQINEHYQNFVNDVNEAVSRSKPENSKIILQKQSLDEFKP